ncbi:phage tail tape measure protein [Citrobacter portucalensis]|uniref:phage tail tape measure protein n=1 Tax=Citrobacter portucalensis TaxID=1639133 RepID=UPI00226BABE6|nr:phage tail tape measure protein [Citrobacter portucalensis]MCX9038479.1 phage tail tape measure protein [Citrobacter portucalensis]
MAGSFSIGVLVSGAMASSFMSTMSGTQRILDKLDTTSQKLTSQQEKLTRATERYGQIGGRAAQRLNGNLERVTRTMAKMEAQQSRLSKWSATGEALKANRMALYGQGVEAYALGRTMLAPAMRSVTNYSDYEAEARNIRVTGELTAAQENSLKSSMLTNASATGQFSSELLKGVGIQVAAGMDATMAQAQAGTMGRVATANQAAIEDLAKLGNAFKQINITGAGDLARAYDAAGWGATQGNFELKDMAKAMPQMFSAFKARGIVGNQANAEIVASLEAGREGAGSNDEAVTNMSNWLSHMGSQDTITKYSKAGVDYQGSMNKLVAGGFSQYEASLEIARQFINSKGKAFTDKWKNAQGDMAAQQKLAESFGLSEVFTDMQTVNHLVAMTQNWDKYQEIKKGMLGKASEGFTDKAFALQMDTVKAKTQQASVELDILSKTVGQQLAPSYSAALTSFTPLIKTTTQWVSQHPAAIRNILQLVTGIVGFRMALVGVKLGLNLVLSPLVSVITTFEQMRSKWLLIRTAFGQGGILRIVATRAAGLARVLSTGLVRGIMLVARSAIFMGRAMLMNPIGLLITGIAVGAYLIYRYWGPISNWFRARWTDIKTAFSGGFRGISALIINWSPLGLFYKAFAGVMRYFKVDMPRNFTEFGSNIISGLVSGIENKWNDAKNKITSLGDSIKGWFTNPLKIKSPSRVFMGYGDNLVQGLAIGIERTFPVAKKSTRSMADHLIPDLPGIPDFPGSASGGGKAMGRSGGVIVHFSPSITIDGKTQEPTGAIRDALNLSMNELEKMLERLMNQKQRRAFE